MASHLDQVERSIWSLLDRYRPALVDDTIYGVASLAWPGAKKHDYFAGVRRGAKAVGLYLLLVDTHPDEWEASPERLRTHRTGRATLTFSTLDDELSAELGDLLDRLFARYRDAHEG